MASRQAVIVCGVVCGVIHFKKRRVSNLKDVGPDQVEQMDQCILVVEADDSKCQVLDSGAGRLTMDNVSVHQSILEKRCHGIDVVLAHFSAKNQRKRSIYGDEEREEKRKRTKEEPCESAVKGLKSIPLFAQQPVVMVDTTGKEV